MAGAERMKRIGVLSLQGGVEEHISALLSASAKCSMPVQVVEVRSREDAEGLDGIILPGGESTTISRLMERENLFPSVLKIRKIFGTCAGAIMLARSVEGAVAGQRFLSLMDITASRNAYGSQLASFEARITTVFGTINGVFIRAPRLAPASKDCQPMAFYGEEVVAAYQKKGERHFLASSFHPELTTTKFHEFFLKL
ncbi:MAG: pyridoxal 5'-phosphate synthase glutaminase subunit PdxT [Candidatus Micrarchaeota archaeon]|nr:pyridoxal 5'-phosphate synthase glutaminase subunit PdxT [Candidatus Micrarchaeota archaeon]